MQEQTRRSSGKMASTGVAFGLELLCRNSNLSPTGHTRPTRHAAVMTPTFPRRKHTTRLFLSPGETSTPHSATTLDPWARDDPSFFTRCVRIDHPEF